MRLVYDRVYVGNQEDCVDEQTILDDWAVVHACKFPCHARAVGYTGKSKISKKHPNYLSVEHNDHLYLNLIDTLQPLFLPASFDIFLKFAEKKYAEGGTLLIHCNQGMSRSASLALLFLTKSLEVLPPTKYEEAVEAYRKFDPLYAPNFGIHLFLSHNWKYLLAAG